MNQNTEKQVSNKQLQEIPMKNQEMRIININSIQPKKYTRNYIRTAKYNWFTFLPLSIFYQFNNYFNCFFLFTAVLTSITIISPLDPATAIGPFLFVLSISLIREAYEDIKKTNYDKMANNSIAQLYSVDEKKFIEMKWSDLDVGKIIKVKKNEMIPADILVIKSSEENGLCYLETTNLDGESALKPRQAIVIYHKKIKQEECLANIIDIVEVDLPNNHIYRVDGSIYFKKGEKDKEFFEIENVLLRGGRLKNVEYVYGIVIYTGRDTKIMQNIKEGLPKQSTIEIKLNTIILFILLIVIFLCVICTVFGAFFRADLLPDYVNNRRKGEYIYYYDLMSSSDSSNDVLEIIRIFAGLFIIFNTLIPISLMIASEIIKTFQVQLIEMDKEMKQDPDDKLKILSMKLHEDLGMVRYIFSDKTGTLTKNEMSFRACSIFAKSFGETDEEADKNHHDENNKIANNINNNNINLNVFNSNQKFASFGKNNINVNNNNEKQNVKKSIFSNTFNKELLRNSILEGGIMNIKDIKESPIQTLGEACKEFFFNISLNHNVLVELEEKEEAALAAIDEATNRQKGELAKSKKFESGKNMDLNSNRINKNIVNVENSDLNNLMNADFNNNDNNNNYNNDNNNNNNNISYQGSNPDEVVLVTAAAEIGIKFLNKDKDNLIVSYFDQLKKFKILQKFEFSSERKRSSIIIKDEEGKIKIYVKGSDEKILHPSNINEFSKKYLLKESKEHLDSFARIGLRTLCFAYKHIEKDAYKKWEQILNNKKQQCFIDKTKNSELEKVISEMEEDLIFLGVTALEDKLQDNVRNDLQEFMEAGISVWMITGDKLDTAESIGHSCKLFNDDTEVFKIKSSEKNETKKCLEDIKKKFDLMKGDCEDLNVLGKQIQYNNAESVTKSGSRNGNGKKSNTKIIKNNKETIINNNNFESPNGISNLNVKTKKTDIPFKLELNQIVYTNENFKELNNKNSDLDKLKNENDINNLLQNTDDDVGAASQNDLNKFLSNNQGLSLNGSPEFNRKDKIKNNRNNDDIGFNYNGTNNIENRIFDVIKINDPNKAVVSDDNNLFEISRAENTNNVNTIREFNNEYIQNGGNLIKNSILDKTKKDDRNEKFNQFDQFNLAEKIDILDQRLSHPNYINNLQNEINIHLPVYAGKDLGSSVKIFNNEKNSIPFSFKDLNAVNSITTKKEKDINLDKIKGNNDFNYNDDNYIPNNTNFGDDFDNVVQNLNNQLETKESFIVVYDEFENGKSQNRAIKSLKNNNPRNLICKKPFVNSIEKENNKQNLIEKREKQLNNFELNENRKKEIAEKDFIFENFRKGELNKKLNSNANLFHVSIKLNLNDELHTDIDLEHNLDLISNDQTPSLNKSLDQKSNKKYGNKTFNSNLSSDEGDEFYDAKRLDIDKSLKNLGNSNNKRRSNFKERKNQKNSAANGNKIKKRASFNINNRRRSLTPNISIIDRNNLIDSLGQKLVEKINNENYQSNNKTNELGKTPMPNETDKENLDISDRSIIEYLMNNHILDDSQGHFYNPTFLGYYINKQNLNDTNNKILQDSNNNNNEKTPNSKSISRNLIKGKISISNLKSLIRERNISNSINLKEIVNSVSQLNNKMADGIIDVSHNGAKNSLKDNSIDVSNNNEIRYDQNNFDLSGNENGVNNRNNLSNSKKIEFEIDGEEMSFKKKHPRMNQEEDSKSRERIYQNSNRKKVKNEGVAELSSDDNNNDYNKDQKTYKRDKTNYADPAMFISTKPRKHKILNLEDLNSKGLQNNEFKPHEDRNSKTNQNIKNQKNADAVSEENENENIEKNNNLQKQSDEKRFLSNEPTKNKKTKSEKVLVNSNTKNHNLDHNTALNFMRDPTKDLLKSSLEKGQKINLNQIMEFLENLILENEKNKKKTLMNLIDFKKSGGTEDPNENIQFKVMNLGVLIEGDSISHCLDDDLKDLFWNIVKNSKSVVCCRCSPKQKAEVVGFVKKKSNEVTLAIGDGGNDIPMIKIANIGVGIFGKEGYQAAFNSDYAISQFKYLKRLIFVHGRNSLLRNSYFIYFFFFKNVLFTLSQLWFCFFSGFSGQNFYDSWYYLGFNSFLSSLPVAARTIVEEDVDLNWVYTNQKDKKINLIPDIYQEYRDSVPFHILKFFFVFITALIYSMIVYFIPFYIFQYNFQDNSGRPFTLYDHSLSSYLAVIIVHFFFLFEDTYFYNWFIFSAYFLQIGVLILFIFVHESLNSGEISGITHDILWNFNFWAVTMLTCAITCLLFLIVRRFDFLFSDTIINSIMQNKFESNFTQKLYKKKLEEIRKFHRSVAKFKKIFKMKNEDFDNLSDKRFKDIVDAYKRNHQAEKKSALNNINKESAENKKHEHQLPILKRAKSQCSDDFNMKDKRTNIYEKITNHGNADDHKKQEGTKRKIQFENDIVNENNNYNNRENDDNAYDRNKNDVKKYQTFNKNNIHLFDFNSHPSKFFNQN